MSESTRTIALLATPNGDARPRARRGKPARRPGPRRRFWTARRSLAAGVGGVGVVLLALSVWHCTEALVVLTGSPAFLAVLLAVGIDMGLVASELAAIVRHDDRRARCWANAYVVSAIVL